MPRSKKPSRDRRPPVLDIGESQDASRSAAGVGPRRNVLMLASEALPFSKTGGLADVLGALPRAVARLGWDVTVAVPRYRGHAAGSLVERFTVTLGGYAREIGAGGMAPI